MIDSELNAKDLSYGELAADSKRFANALTALGIGRDDKVATLSGKSRDLVVALVGIWRVGAVHVPLFTAFATPAIDLRLSASGTRVVVVDPGQRSKLESLEGLTIIETGDEFERLLRENEPEFDSVAVGNDGVIVEIFTSGTTGTPKAVPVPLRAVASFRSYLHFGLDVRKDDVFWNVADPGWAYGLYIGIIAVLAEGTRNLLVKAGFSAELTAEVIRKFGVTNFAGAPTIFRALIREPKAQGLTPRRASSAGEPLTDDILEWSRKSWGLEVRDHYGQTELGMVIGNGWHDDVSADIIHGSMGQPLPGFTATVLDGEIVFDVRNSPLYWFTGYANAPQQTSERFTPDGHWYRTSDVAQENPDGFFFFAARSDDVILMAGYRIGPFEVESVLLSDDRVVDTAVVGKPDERLGEALVAYIVLADGTKGSASLTKELKQVVKEGFAAHAYPRRIFYVDALPKTPSGKVQRHLLRQIEDNAPVTA
ncbi:AMP-binding protein [Cryobacterium sp. TMT1-3]|uniref:AMP-binding protein n=1 Tax=Cryobacterium sp. TMT1-3 TaxID=1259237 RepID=UPI001F53F2A6|nr:AMP-binding protein [Cryobacterium sp. TMT1-3]